jgi:hypothetical protein
MATIQLAIRDVSVSSYSLLWLYGKFFQLPREMHSCPSNYLNSCLHSSLKLSVSRNCH